MPGRIRGRRYFYSVSAVDVRGNESAAVGRGKRNCAVVDAYSGLKPADLQSWRGLKAAPPRAF